MCKAFRIGFVQAFILAIVVAIPAWAGAAKESGREQAGRGPKLDIVATTVMIGDAVRAIGGSRVDVTVLIGPGIDPHMYKPNRTDMIAIAEADGVFYNGLRLEGGITRALERTRGGGGGVWAVADAIDPSKLIQGADDHGDDHDGDDPHVWMDPRVWSDAIGAVRDGLIDLDPAGKGTYRAAADAYLKQVAAVDAYAEEAIRTVPAELRVLVTAHDAFGYLGERYGIEVVGVQGVSTESEAGVRDIERLVDMLVTRKIKAVFVESSVSGRGVRAIIEGAAARGHTVRIGGELFSDSMGAAGTYEGTYVGMMDHNVTMIVRALGGEAPEVGMHGKITSDEHKE